MNGQVVGDDVLEDVETLPVDLAANARSLGAHVIECEHTWTYVEQSARHLMPKLADVRFGDEKWFGWLLSVTSIGRTPEITA